MGGDLDKVVPVGYMAEMTNDAHVPMPLRPHITRLRRLGRSNRLVRARYHAMPERLQDAARTAFENGLPIRLIAEALGCSRNHAHRLVHGRSDRPPRPAA